MYHKGLCRGCADFYKAWAYYHEAAGDFQGANRVFQYGKQEIAQPYEDLCNAHQNLVIAAGNHVYICPSRKTSCYVNFFRCCMVQMRRFCLKSDKL